MLTYFILLMGYSVNSAAIELPDQELPTGEGAIRILAEESSSEEGHAGFSRPLVASVAFYLVSKLCRRRSSPPRPVDQVRS